MTETEADADAGRSEEKVLVQSYAALPDFEARFRDRPRQEGGLRQPGSLVFHKKRHVHRPSRVSKFNSFAMLLRTVGAMIFATGLHAFAPPPRTCRRSKLSSLRQQPSSASPAARPPTAEEAVQAQLRHYRASRLPEVFDGCSAQSREAVGSLPAFEDVVRAPPYDLLLGHARADVLLEKTAPPGSLEVPDSGGGTAVAAAQQRSLLVCVRPGATARRRHPAWFWWEVSRVATPGEDIEAAPWLVDCVLTDSDYLDLEAEALSLDELEEDGDSEDDDELTIYWDIEA